MGFNVYINQTRDTYFSLWQLTEFGAGHPDEVRRTIQAASAMIRSQSGAECHLFIPVGGLWDFIGVAWGIDDERIVAIQQAIRSTGTFDATFVKAREFTLAEFVKFSEMVEAFRKPPA
jgi:uncharacterized protein with GYD domain